jgi:hypothetical protein
LLVSTAFFRQHASMVGFVTRRQGLAIGVGVIVLICAAAGVTYYAKRPKQLISLPSLVSALAHPASSSASAPEQPENATPAEGPSLSLTELTPADMPPSVTLQKPAEIRFKKGSYFVAKAGAPLFFLTEYVRDAKEGEQFQILDYNPGTRHVYLRAQDPNGNPIAVNTLDLHGCSKDVVTVPASTTVTLQGISDGNALVAYNGDRFAVPVRDTDLLEQAAARRTQRSGGGGN